MRCRSNILEISVAIRFTLRRALHFLPLNEKREDGASERRFQIVTFLRRVAAGTQRAVLSFPSRAYDVRCLYSERARTARHYLPSHRTRATRGRSSREAGAKWSRLPGDDGYSPGLIFRP